MPNRAPQRQRKQALTPCGNAATYVGVTALNLARRTCRQHHHIPHSAMGAAGRAKRPMGLLAPSSTTPTLPAPA